MRSQLLLETTTSALLTMMVELNLGLPVEFDAGSPAMVSKCLDLVLVLGSRNCDICFLPNLYDLYE